jgi:hypothetical protein
MRVLERTLLEQDKPARPAARGSLREGEAALLPEHADAACQQRGKAALR